MRWLGLVLIVALSQVYGCATGLRPYADSSELFTDGQTLWEVRIGRGSSQRFAGLLALNKKGEVLEVVLLDSTGIKLLEEKVLATGKVEIVSALPVVRNNQLGSFLGEGLFRLFFNSTEFTAEPCRGDGLFELCFGLEEEGHLVKFKRLGPFVLWSGDYFISNYDSLDVLTGAVINGGWLTPYLKLKKSGGRPE
ncbi:MAG: hypothetical protein KKB30_02815 [Proteobacteria bacterium]|nr:hypothetical protein [Pseudomonadota bacterium]MBU1716726.1 hypothetical protein [Pseudomonadota bacterium]